MNYEDEKNGSRFEQFEEANLFQSDCKKHTVGQWVNARKFYIRRNNNKVDSIEIEHIVTVDLFP